MAKQMVFDDAARQPLAAGVSKLAEPWSVRWVPGVECRAG